MADASCALMAARLKQIAREQKRVLRGATVAVLRDVVGQAEQRYTIAGAMARNVWGYTSRNGTFRMAFARGRKVTIKSLGLSSRTKARDRVGSKWDRLRADRSRASASAARVRARTGKKAYPLIVRINKTKWRGDVLQTGVRAGGIAGNIEQGTPFKSHGQHPGGAVHPHPILNRAMTSQSSVLSANVKAAVEGFMAGALGG